MEVRAGNRGETKSQKAGSIVGPTKVRSSQLLGLETQSCVLAVGAQDKRGGALLISSFSSSCTPSAQSWPQSWGNRRGTPPPPPGRGVCCCPCRMNMLISLPHAGLLHPLKQKPSSPSEDRTPHSPEAPSPASVPSNPGVPMGAQGLMFTSDPPEMGKTGLPLPGGCIPRSLPPGQLAVH